MAKRWSVKRGSVKRGTAKRGSAKIIRRIGRKIISRKSKMTGRSRRGGGYECTQISNDEVDHMCGDKEEPHVMVWKDVSNSNDVWAICKKCGYYRERPLL